LGLRYYCCGFIIGGTCCFRRPRLKQHPAAFQLNDNAQSLHSFQLTPATRFQAGTPEKTTPVAFGVLAQSLHSFQLTGKSFSGGDA